MKLESLYLWYARYFAKRRFAKFNNILFNLAARGLGVLNYHDLRSSGEHHFIHHELAKYALSTVIDVGANEGNYALEFSERPGCSLHCFEPNPATFDRLTHKLSAYPAIHLWNIGLSDQPEAAVMYDYKGDADSQRASLYKEVHTQFYQEEVEAIPITLRTLDAFVQEQGIAAIDLLKIDTEGNEYKVLLGAGEALRQGKIKIIHFEFNMMNVISRVFLKDFVDLLPDYNFYRLLPDALLPIPYNRPLTRELFAFQNIVAIRRETDLTQR